MTAKDYSTYRLKPCLVLHRGHNMLCFLVFVEEGVQCVHTESFALVDGPLEAHQALALLMPVNQAAIRYMRQLLELPETSCMPNPYLEEGSAEVVVDSSPVSIAVQA